MNEKEKNPPRIFGGEYVVQLNQVGGGGGLLLLI